jgi:hypothetical protein
LNFKLVTAGAEAAQVARWSKLYKQKKPVIFYWYTPQYLNQEYDLAEVKLPKRFNGCKDDAKAGGDPQQYRCAYDDTIINKLFSKQFANSGSPAYPVLKAMRLTNDGQSWSRSGSPGTRLIRRRRAGNGSATTPTRSIPGSTPADRGRHPRQKARGGLSNSRARIVQEKVGPHGIRVNTVVPKPPDGLLGDARLRARPAPRRRPTSRCRERIPGAKTPVSPVRAP